MTIRLPTSTMSTSREQHQHQVRLGHAEHLGQQVEQLHEELDAERDQRERHAEVDGRQDPAAGEQQFLDRSFHHGRGLNHSPRPVFFRAACARRRPRATGKSGNASRKRCHRGRPRRSCRRGAGREFLRATSRDRTAPLGVGVGGRPRLAAECRPRDRVARTGGAPLRCAAAALPVTATSCNSGRFALGRRVFQHCRAIGFVSGRGGLGAHSTAPAARLRAAPLLNR